MEKAKAQGKTQAGQEGSPPQNRPTVFQKSKNDGSLSVRFIENEMEARADFTPPMGKGSPLSMDFIRVSLDRLKIVHGIRWQAIEQAHRDCVLNHKPLRDVVIARGDMPSSEVAPFYELDPQLKRNGVPRGPTENIDYRTFSPFIIVKKDQPLAKLQDRRPGKDGMNVLGAPIPFEVLHPPGLAGGTNTRTEDNTIFAEIHGQMIEKGGLVSIQETLVIKGAVGYTTGNIIFPGDVIIEGPVSDGFKIHSGASVTIKQTFDVTDAITKNDLNVAGGIIGRGRALVKVGGALKTKFIENCRVACRQAITVEGGIINSNVFTMERLDMGEKGSILGGEIYAIHGITTGSIGKKGSKYARLHCGIDFTARQEMEKHRNTLRIGAAKLRRLQSLTAPPENQNIPPEKLAKMEEMLRSLEEEQQKLSARISELMGKINIDGNAQVEVLGEIQPGTLIEICEAVLFVTDPLRKVRIRLDQSQGQGKLVTEPL